jgi:translation elongation factor EF-Tu-like GTPase
MFFSLCFNISFCYLTVCSCFAGRFLSLSLSLSSGTVCTGACQSGKVKIGDALEVVGFGETLKSTCTGVEMFHKLLDAAQAGDNAGILLRGLKREDIRRGQVLAAPGSVSQHKKFRCEVFTVGAQEGFASLLFTFLASACFF